MKLTDDIQYLKGVGPKLTALYQKVGVQDLYDLLQYYPRHYLDFTNPVRIADSVVGQVHAIRARVFKKGSEQRIRKNLTVYKLFVTDDEHNMTVTIFNSKFLFDAIKIDQTYLFYGKVSGNLLRREMSAPSVYTLEQANTLQPVYPLTEGLTTKTVQKHVRSALDSLGDLSFEPIPDSVREAHELCYLRYALENIHFPKDSHTLQTARKRLVFEELLTLQLGLLMLRRRNQAQTAVRLKDNDISAFVEALPFTLTQAQTRAIDDCLADLQKDTPMNRLIQGDVGSGKTMVAAAVMYACKQNGFQAVMMAPTELLAMQHYQTLCKTLQPLGVSVVLLTGSMPKKEKLAIKQQIANGSAQIIIGTHALLQADTVFANLGLVVTDEQHRFGVSQRAKLKNKGDNPHVLVMSATPIPRTLALIIYGDLDVSVIDQLPAGRQQIDTLVIDSTKRERAFGFIKQQLQQGRQAYLVCPLIEQTAQTDLELQNVNDYAKQLQNGALRGFRIGVLHSHLKAAQKEAVMQDFARHQLDVIVSTTVVEVGVDVPNATIMLIENAERFGLSQLHQLRGRVGRGTQKSYCILVSNHTGELTKQRLKMIKESTDGFLIAQQDLKLRGPGDFFGARQHGLPDLKIADMADDLQILKQTQAVAKQLLQQDPDLSAYEHKGLRFLIARLFAKKES